MSSPHFSVLIPEGVKGYAVVVSKKTAPLSVTRHRMKRRVLAAMRTLTLPPALVVYPKASIKEINPKELRAELEVLFSRIPG